ncbi:hypothetical protein Vadar_032118 [Vaccinium darrowii]|uniref:Uncharacterized protein n=1 Tax=Vaccinium darrowii TaxID=229202 RepID=A0ACB7YHJ6_9ERIC|nr:hypothetical protein Vadar_032118 [Vaccinium darrowii]
MGKRFVSVLTFSQDKEMAAAKSKGKEKVIATNKRKYNACPVVGYLREKNVGVVIREEQANVIRSARDTEMAEANSKGKEKVISASKGKENAFPVVPIFSPSSMHILSSSMHFHDNEVQNTPVEVDAIAHVSSSRHFLGEMSTTCSSCGALHWMDEKLAHSSKKNPCFGTCCLQGKVKLPPLMTPPPPIQALYDGNDDRSKSFRVNTRSYNAANAFTSLGAKFDDRVFSGRGPTSFTIHGELRHRTGSLMPLPGEDPSYAQLYIYDPNSALDVRDRRNPHLRRDVLEIIQESLLQVNEFVGKFRQAHAILNQLALSGQNLPAHLHYTVSTDRRRYNLPTSDEIAVIISGDGTEASGMRDIVLHLCGNNELMRINECHPAYLPLHYVLLFPHGELGWDPDLQQWDVDNEQPSTNRLTQKQYYSYRFFEHDELRSRQIEVSEGGITPTIVEIEGSDANLFVFQTLGKGARLYGSGAGYGRRPILRGLSLGMLTSMGFTGLVELGAFVLCYVESHGLPQFQDFTVLNQFHGMV